MTRESVNFSAKQSLQTKEVNEVKAKKYRKNPELLQDSILSCSQFSVLQSDDSQDLCDTFSQQSLEERSQSPSRPLTYNKQQLNSPMSQKSRRR